MTEARPLRARRRWLALCGSLATLAVGGCAAPGATRPAQAPVAPPAPAAPPPARPVAPLPPLLDRVRALGLASWPGARITAWAAPQDVTRAHTLQALLDEAAAWCDATLGTALPPVHLAVLWRPDWDAARIGQPYGIPGVAGRPPVVFMPAGDDGLAATDALAIREQVSPSTLSQLAAAGWRYEEAAARHVDLIGLHELGHVTVPALGLKTPGAWLNEWLATYFGYAFLRARHPTLAALWDGVLQAYVDAVQPRHRTLEDFDRLYFRVGARNYVWYQAMFQQQVRAVHDARGAAFLQALQPALTDPARQAPAQVLARLEAVQPGFVAWAAAMASATG